MSDKKDLKNPDTEGKEKEEAEDTSYLVRLRKNGEELEVHPTCVDAHLALGWKPVK
jgi:hypothetical protein